jgi:hypothetical protein
VSEVEEEGGVYIAEEDQWELENVDQAEAEDD